MKRLMTLTLLTLSFLGAYELSTDSWGRYTTFDPDTRVAFYNYPSSWMKPGAILFDHDYQDSSSSYGSWDQIFTNNESISYSYGLSGDVVAKYTPYSFPHRWSAGLEFVNYKGPNSTYRTDAVLHYQHKKGAIEYYHTTNNQKITLNTDITDHNISSNGLNLDYQISTKFKVLGSIDYNLIGQTDTSSRTYDFHHEFVEVQYSFAKAFTAYTKFHYWYYTYDDREGPAKLLFPGIRYNSKLFMGNISFRLSPTTVHPIAELAVYPGPLYVHVYTKARSSRLAFSRGANQYAGIKAGLKHDSEHHYLYADMQANYDFVRTGQPDSIINSDFYGVNAKAEYRFKTPSIELYSRATYNQIINPREGYYHPERSIITGGLNFHAKLAEGNLLLDGDINAQYIIHDDPDDVSFNPTTLSYSHIRAGDLVSDWKINFELKARIQTFMISAIVSTPLKLNEDLNYYFYEGIYTSSDLVFGNTFYAGLSISWLWWK